MSSGDAQLPVSDLLDLTGATALVTGAARGIGLAIAQRLVEAGATVILSDIDANAVKAAAESLANPRTIPVTLDVSRPDSVAAAFETINERGSGLDILVNNAGIYPVIAAAETTDQDVDRVFGVNVAGPMRCIRAALPLLKTSKRGVVVNLASVNSYRASTVGMLSYTMSKHAVVGMTKALGLEFGRFNIRVLGVAPTVIMTPGVAAAMPQTMDIVDQIAAMCPLGRLGQPDDVARVVLFCASPMAAFMTGSTILVDGGTMAV